MQYIHTNKQEYLAQKFSAYLERITCRRMQSIFGIKSTCVCMECIVQCLANTAALVYMWPCLRKPGTLCKNKARIKNLKNRDINFLMMAHFLFFTHSIIIWLSIPKLWLAKHHTHENKHLWPALRKVPLGQKIRICVCGTMRKRVTSAIRWRKPRLRSTFLRWVIRVSVVALDYTQLRENAHWSW